MRPKLLFVCVENSCRSQIAEGFARALAGDRVEAFSAGSRPSGVVNPRAIATMDEVGIDLSGHESGSLDDVPTGPYAAVVTMGCGDECPHVPAVRREDWPIPDPKHMPSEQFREVRDEIRRRVERLVAEIAPSG